MTGLPRRAFGLLAGCMGLLPVGVARADILARTGPIALGAEPVRVSLGSGPDLTARLRALAPGRKVRLVIRGMHADSPPGVLFGLFLGLEPDAVLPDDDDPRAVGTINFYAAQSPLDVPFTMSFDVTKKLRLLVDKMRPSNEISLTVVPMDSPARNAGAMLGAVELLLE